MSATLYHGTTLMRDYTPESAVSAGDIVAIGTTVCVAHKDIAAGALGAVAYPSGTAVYRVTLKENAAFSDGDLVYVDPTTMEADPAESDFFGYAVNEVDESTGDTEVRAVHDKMSGVDVGS